MEDKRKEEKKSIIEDNLNRISSDFELDVLRLIKTQSMISTTSEIIDNESETVKKRSEEFQEILKDFSNKLLERTKNLPEFENDPSDQKDINELLSTIEDYRNRVRKIRDEVEQVTRENLSRLTSLHEFYSMELRAYQEGLDTRIQDLQKSIANTLDIDEHELDLTSGMEYMSDEGTGQETQVDKKEHAEPLFNSQDNTKQKNGAKHTVPKRYIAALVLILLAAGVYIYQVVSPSTVLNGYFGDTVKTDTGKQEVIGEPAVNKKTGEGAVVTPPPGQDTSASDVKKPEGVEVSQEDVGTNTSKTEPDAVTNGDVSEAENDSSTDRIEEPPRKTLYTIKVRGANVRTGPGKGYEVITVVRSGDTFEKTSGETERWMKIRTESGQDGWIAKGLVKETGK